jgi:exodeoxyribonuclease VIII
MNAPERLMGLVRDLPAEQYHAIEAMSSTGLRLFARSPWHWKNRVPVTPTRAMLNGTLAHCAQLEPDAMAARYVVVPENAPARPTERQWNAAKSNESSTAAKAWWSEFLDSVGQRQIVAANDYAITQAQLRAIAADPYLAELFSRGYAEASAFCIDKATGVYCKARPDWVHPIDSKRVKMVDLKTTADESPDGFSRAVTTLGHHRQRAHYISVFEQATGLEVVEFIFAAVTSAAPVLAVPYVLDIEDATQGEDECAELLERFAWCQRENEWPAYGSGPQVVGLQKWAKRSTEVEVSFVE